VTIATLPAKLFIEYLHLQGCADAHAVLVRAASPVRRRSRIGIGSDGTGRRVQSQPAASLNMDYPFHDEYPGEMDIIYSACE
jgi:hypothetical protein